MFNESRANSQNQKDIDSIKKLNILNQYLNEVLDENDEDSDSESSGGSSDSSAKNKGANNKKPVKRRKRAGSKDSEMWE